MKKLNFIKIALDIIMLVAFVLLFNYKVPGMLFHEVVGLAIGALVLLHCGLNWKWIKGITLKIFKSKLPTKTRIGYCLNILLLLSFIFIIISGVLISKKLFPDLALSVGKGLQGLHTSLSYFCLLLIGIHIGLHWNWVMIILRKMFKITGQKRIYTYISRILVALVLVFGIYSAYSVKLLSKISMASVFSTSTSTDGGSENGMKRGDFKPTESADGSTQERRKPMEGASGSKQEIGKSKGNGQDISSIFGVITSNLGIVSAFSIITFYTEKLLTKRKKKESYVVIP